ncbi:hypothetical protein ACWGRF_28860 [Streptomyces zhihengii]
MDKMKAKIRDKAWQRASAAKVAGWLAWGIFREGVRFMIGLWW